MKGGGLYVQRGDTNMIWCNITANTAVCVSFLHFVVVCDVMLEFTGISFTKKTFSPVWRIIQSRLKVAPKKKYHEEYLFQDEPVELSDEDLFE